MNHLTFRLNESDANLVLTALGEMQAKITHNLINTIVTQIEQQRAAQAAPATGMGLEGNHALGQVIGALAEQQQSLNSGSAVLAHPQ